MTRPHARPPAPALVATLTLGLLVAACGPDASASAPSGAQPPAKTAAKPRKCPHPDLRDTRDPCSIAYLEPYKPRFKRDKF